MRSSDHITLLRGGHEEYLEEITDVRPHVLERVELVARYCLLKSREAGSLGFAAIGGRRGAGA